MKVLQAIWSEITGLFFDEGRFAGTLIGWIVVAGIVLPRLRLPAGLSGCVLFLGLAAILVESALRRARR